MQCTVHHLAAAAQGLWDLAKVGLQAWGLIAKRFGLSIAYLLLSYL
jgi:hypothetical protein